MKKINLAISGCMGKMGQQLIKSASKSRAFKLVSLTENRKINRKILGIKPELNSIYAFKNADIIIDFTVPRCTLEILKIAAKNKKKSSNWNNWFYKKRGKNNKKILRKNSNFKSWKYEFRCKLINVFNRNYSKNSWRKIFKQSL